MNSTQTVKILTLEEAIQFQIEQFSIQNESFSIHDITTALRKKTASGDLEIPECDISGSSLRCHIGHAQVKSLFEALYNGGSINPAFDLTRVFTGMFFKYTPNYTAPSANVSGGVSTPPSAAPATPTPTTSVSVSNPRSVVLDRIKLYLTNCTSRNFRPTIKQVQSSIKRGEKSTGYTAVQLVELIEKDLGYTVVQNPDFISSSQVVL